MSSSHPGCQTGELQVLWETLPQKTSWRENNGKDAQCLPMTSTWVCTYMWACMHRYRAWGKGGGRERETESKRQRQRDDTQRESGKQRDRHTLGKEKKHLYCLDYSHWRQVTHWFLILLGLTVITQRPDILKNVNLETLFKISITEPSLHVKP